MEDYHLHRGRIPLGFNSLLATASISAIFGSRTRSLAASLALALVALALVCVALARAVSEESIPASDSLAPVSQTEKIAPRTSDGSSVVEPAAPSATMNEAPRPPRATFPYVVRPGDNWGAIAGLFGVSLADLIKTNRATEDTELMVGQTLRIPNPAVARERELTEQVDQLSRRVTEAEQQARQSEASLGEARNRVAELSERQQQVAYDLRTVYWWRGATYLMAVVSVLMLVAAATALVDWWRMRYRFRVVAEANESLRRLDYRYRNALARAELRLQELYGRRRRGLRDGPERARLTEETEIDALNRELKATLQHYLNRLKPGHGNVSRVSSEVQLGGIGAPVEPRAVRR